MIQYLTKKNLSVDYTRIVMKAFLNLILTYPYQILDQHQPNIDPSST